MTATFGTANDKPVSERLLARLPGGRVPFRPAVSDGESLLSLMGRHGRDLGVSWYDALSHGSLMDVAYHHAETSAVGLWLHPDRVPLVAHRLWMTTDEVLGMTVARFGSLLPPVDPGTGERDAAASLRRGWRFSSAHSRYCPACLAADDGAWQLSWRLPWHHTCRRHGLLLADTCPSCGRPAQSGSDARRPTGRVPFATRVPTPTLCTARLEVGGDPCGADLTAVEQPAGDAANQETIDGWLHRHDNRRLVDALALAGFAVSTSAVDGGTHGRGNTGTRDVLASSRIALDAFRLAVPPLAGARDGWARFVDATAEGPRPLVSAGPAASPGTVEEFHHHRRMTSARLSIRARATVAPTVAALPEVWRTAGADGLPTMMWRCWFDELFAGSVPATRAGREFVSVTIAGLLSGTSWEEAAGAFSMPGRPNEAVVLSTVRRHPRGFESALDETLGRLASHPVPFGYGLARRTLAGWFGIDDDLWADHRAAGRHLSPSTRGCVSAWVYADLTGANPRRWFAAVTTHDGDTDTPARQRMAAAWVPWRRTVTTDDLAALADLSDRVAGRLDIPTVGLRPERGPSLTDDKAS